LPNPLSIVEFSTLRASFEEDLVAYATAGIDGIGICELKLVEGREAEQLAAFRESGLRASSCVPAVPSILPLLAVPAAALIAFDAVSLLWAHDLEQGSIELAFFIFPFSVLVAVVARSPFVDWLPRALAVTLLGLATVFAAIGICAASRSGKASRRPRARVTTPDTPKPGSSARS